MFYKNDDGKLVIQMGTGDVIVADIAFPDKMGTGVILIDDKPGEIGRSHDDKLLGKSTSVKKHKKSVSIVFTNPQSIHVLMEALLTAEENLLKNIENSTAHSIE